MPDRTVISSLIAFFLMLYFSGCATYSELPSGSRVSVGERPVGVIERQVIEVTLSPEMPYKSADYVIGPNDVLSINISGKPEFSQSFAGSRVTGYRVDGRGYISIPLAGEVRVGNLTLSEVRSRVYTAMQPYFNNPWVVVEIVEYRNRQIFVFGAVKKPGPVPLPAVGMNLAQAIASAELRDTGYDFRHVRIIRSLSPTQGELLVVDFDRILRGKVMPMQLREGDIVYVPKSRVGSWNEVIADLLPSLQVVSSALQPFVNIKYLKN